MKETSVNFVLLLFDDFSGTKVNDAGIIFTVNQRLVYPIRKPEGYYVFIGLEGDVFDVLITLPKYKHKSVIIHTKSTLKKVVNLRLYRKDTTYFGDCERFTGSIKKANAKVFTTADDYPMLKLQSFEEDKRQITIAGLAPKNILNLNLAIGTGKSLEIFTLEERLSSNTYLLTENFLYQHKQGQAITRAFVGMSDDEGNYAIPIEPSDIAKLSKAQYYDEEKKTWL